MLQVQNLLEEGLSKVLGRLWFGVLLAPELLCRVVSESFLKWVHHLVNGALRGLLHFALAIAVTATAIAKRYTNAAPQDFALLVRQQVQRHMHEQLACAAPLGFLLPLNDVPCSGDVQSQVSCYLLHSIPLSEHQAAQDMLLLFCDPLVWTTHFNYRTKSKILVMRKTKAQCSNEDVVGFGVISSRLLTPLLGQCSRPIGKQMLVSKAVSGSREDRYTKVG